MASGSEVSGGIPEGPGGSDCGLSDPSVSDSTSEACCSPSKEESGITMSDEFSSDPSSDSGGMSGAMTRMRIWS